MTISCIAENGISSCQDPFLYSKLLFIAFFILSLLVLYRLSDRWFR